MPQVLEHSAPAEQQVRRRPGAYLMAPSASDHKFFGFLISASGVTRSDRVLDVACGAGSASLAFAERCASVVGVEVLPEPLKRARGFATERKIANTIFVQSEIERLPFADRSFNGAICRFSFHHIAHPEQVFAEMARVLAPDGWMAIADMVAPDDADEAALHNQMERLCDPTHARALSTPEFERMFADHGFRLAMKVARDSRITFDDWVRFGPTAPDDVRKLRAIVEEALGSGRTSRFVRDGDRVRVLHTSVSFILEKESS